VGRQTEKWFGSEKKKKGKKAAKQYEYEQSLGKEERCVSF